MSIIGYSRVSTADQDPRAQIQALRSAGCERIFTDHASGASTARPQFNAALDYLRRGDVLVVWRLDRLGRSLPHLMETVETLGQRGIELRSLTEAIDTTTSTGRLVFHIAGAFAQFERDLIRERTLAGLAAARAQGRTGGRPTVMSPQRVEQAQAMRSSGASLATIANVLGVGKSSVWRALTTQHRS